IEATGGVTHPTKRHDTFGNRGAQGMKEKRVRVVCVKQDEAPIWKRIDREANRDRKHGSSGAVVKRCRAWKPCVSCVSLGCSCIEFEEEEDEMEVDYQCPILWNLITLLVINECNDITHSALGCVVYVCPVCSRRVKMHMVDHIITHHRDVLKISFYLIDRLYKEESYSALSPGTKKYVQSLIDGPLSTNHASKGVPDSLLSFVYNPPSPNQPKLVLPDLSSGANTQDKSLIKRG
ncbi:hypothetical protein F2Q70_00016657, partial [Brassica cretica]